MRKEEKKYWKYLYEPKKPTPPTMVDEVYETAEEVVYCASQYTETPIETLIERRDEWQEKHKHLKGLRFYVCAEKDYSGEESSAELTLTAAYTRARDESSAKQTRDRNKRWKEEYEQAVELYPLQYADWQQSIKEMDEESAEKERQLYQHLKQKFEK